MWEYTFCYGCRASPPHVDWYHDDGEHQLSADDMIDLEVQSPTVAPS